MTNHKSNRKYGLLAMTILLGLGLTLGLTTLARAQSRTKPTSASSPTGTTIDVDITTDELDPGGALYLSGSDYGPTDIRNSTLSDNNAGDRGGAIYSYYPGVAIEFSTIVSNSAGTSGGGVFENEYSVWIQNSILAGQGPEIRLTHSANGADQADVAVDANGNVHIVYADADNSNNDRGLWYTMLDNFGYTLIDDTPITPADDYDSTRPAIVVDSKDKVHITWRDKRWDDASTQEVTYTKLDPYLDDRDGGPADPAAITLVDDTQLTTIGNWYIYSIRLAVDSGDNVHIVWDDEDAYTINYMKLDENGNTLIAPTVLRTADQRRQTLPSTPRTTYISSGLTPKTRVRMRPTICCWTAAMAAR